MKTDDAEAGAASIVAFRCPAALCADIERQAAEEGLSVSAVARRAALIAMRRARERKVMDPSAPARARSAAAAILARFGFDTIMQLNQKNHAAKSKTWHPK